MTDKNLPTIKLKGKEYVMVRDRIIFFNEGYPTGSIVTEVKYKKDGSYAWFKAIITPDIINTPSRIFVAHSAGPVDEEKSYEKLETVAVGRALALMGIGILEGIASADEIEKFNPPKINDLGQKCNKCGKSMKLRKSAKGEFWGCTGYPNCKNIVNIQEQKYQMNNEIPLPPEYN